jgi:predicted dehydrogenase
MVRVGVVGYGYWGPNLVRNFVEIPASTLAAVADLDQKRLDHLQTRYPGVQTTKDYRELFRADLDAMVIATPPATHFRLAKDALLHGLHVLVEKPLTLASRDAQELVRLAEEHDRVLMAGHTFIYNPAVRAIKQMIESEEIGRVYYVDTVRASLGLFQRDLNVLWDLAPHDLSILSYLLGCYPIGVGAHGVGCVQYGIEDVAYMTLLFPNYTLAHVHVSWLDPCKVRRITVVGSKKMVVYDDIESLEKVRVYDKGVDCPPYTNSFGDFRFAYRYGDITIPHIKLAEPLRLECEHFLECILERRRPRTDGYDGLAVVKIIEVAQKSLRNNGSQEQIIYEFESKIVGAQAEAIRGCKTRA